MTLDKFLLGLNKNGKVIFPIPKKPWTCCRWAEKIYRCCIVDDQHLWANLFSSLAVWRLLAAQWEVVASVVDLSNSIHASSDSWLSRRTCCVMLLNENTQNVGSSSPPPKSLPFWPRPARKGITTYVLLYNITVMWHETTSPCIIISKALAHISIFWAKQTLNDLAVQ